MTSFKKKFIFYGSLLTASIIAGGLFFCIYNEWLLISWNRPTRTALFASSHSTKNIHLSMWKNNGWYQEQVSTLWSENLTQATQTLVTHWLALLKEEGMIDKSIALESVLASPSGQEVYISLNRNLFDKQWSAHQKHHCIEGLLKTMRDNNLTCSGVYFLVHHQPLVDYHLDFSIAWPLSGFIG